MKSLFKPISTEQEYREAMAFISNSEDAAPGTELGNQLGAVAILIEKYESENFKLEDPDHQDVLQFLMDQFGFNQTDLAGILGCSKSAISEMLKGRRELTKRHIRTLHEKFNIPYECFFSRELIARSA